MNADQMYERDGWHCLSCGAASNLTTQHRHNRGAGGEDEELSERPSNRCTLCLFCNNALESDARFAMTGRRFGWKLVAGESPTEVAVYDVTLREWHLLDDEGTFRIVDDREPDLVEWKVAS